MLHSLIALITFSQFSLPDAPKLLPSQSVQIHKQGEIAVILCVIQSGLPPFRFDWYKNGQNIRESQTVELVNSQVLSTLHLKKLTVDDGGNYSCSVSNSYGSDSLTTQILIEGKSLIICSFLY